MAERIPDLWPADIVADVLSPTAILKQQASRLRERTKGMLEARVQATPVDPGKVQLDFEIIAPPLDGYTYVLFSARHDRQRVYPVEVTVDPRGGSLGDQLATIRRHARMRDSSPSEFIETVADILQSPETRAVLVSLLAQINDARSITPETVA